MSFLTYITQHISIYLFTLAFCETLGLGMLIGQTKEINNEVSKPIFIGGINVHGDFPIYGLYYDQLSNANIQILYDVPMVFKHIVYYGPNGRAEMPLNIKLELFLQENDYGTHVSKEHLNAIKETLMKQTKD